MNTTQDHQLGRSFQHRLQGLGRLLPPVVHAASSSVSAGSIWARRAGGARDMRLRPACSRMLARRSVSSRWERGTGGGRALSERQLP